MSQRTLEEFGAYRKANELFALMVSDMRRVQKDPLCFKLVSQQVGSFHFDPSGSPGGFALPPNAPFVGCQQGRAKRPAEPGGETASRRIRRRKKFPCSRGGGQL